MENPVTSKFTFDPKTHSYTLNSHRLPSVTQVIQSSGLVQGAFFSDYARDRGSYVHEAIQLLIEGTFDEITLDPILKPYLDAYKKFVRDTNFSVKMCEQPVYSETYHFAGTPDLVGDFLGKRGDVIIDVKTSLQQSWHKIQTSGYRILLDKPAKRYGLYLDDTGKYKLIEHGDRQDEGIFHACLTLHGWKINQGVK